MKDNYENRQSYSLIRRIPVIIRIDGKAFHTYTKGLDKPFDDDLILDMNRTAIYLCENIQGAKCAYTQSDEISILVTDYDNLETDAWFDYNVQKMCSISASLATAIFNQLRFKRQIVDFLTYSIQGREDVVNYANNYYEAHFKDYTANFDSRVFNIPKEEVANYFLARQKDAVKNSISMVARHYYSHKELENKNSSEMQEMIFQKGFNWNDLDSGKKRGRFIVKNIYINDKLVDDMLSFNKQKNDIIRNKWEVVETPLTFNHKHFEQWL